MEKRSTFNQMFFVRKNRVKSNGEVPIYLRITLNGKQAELSLHLTVELKFWNVSTGTAIGLSKKSKSLNSHLILRYMSIISI